MTLSEVSRLIDEYRGRGVFLDTNLLLLFVVALRSSERVHSHRRLQKFTPADAEVLYRFCGLFSRIVTLPHVLTQTSDLLGDHEQLYLKQMIDVAHEESVPSREVATLPQFSYLGLADAAVLSRIAGSFLVLSDDRLLVTEVQALNGGALQFGWLQAIGT